MRSGPTALAPVPGKPLSRTGAGWSVLVSAEPFPSTGVGLGVGFGVALGVAFGVGLGFGLGVGFGVALGVGFGVGLGVTAGSGSIGCRVSGSIAMNWEFWNAKYAP